MYGACDATESFTSVPVQRYVEPRYVNANRTTELAALDNAAEGFAMHATSISHEPDVPIALNGSGPAFNSAAPAAVMRNRRQFQNGVAREDTRRQRELDDR